MRKALEYHGIDGELILATDGEIAIAFIDDLDAERVACPQLAIIDLNLPRKPGRHVLERMRNSPACGRIPVAILSSSDAEQDRAAATRLGASRYLRKPSRLEEFLNLGVVFKEMLGQTTQ